MRTNRMKKAQLSMDFVFTYGWAILAMIVILAILIYFGVRDTQRFMPDQCAFLSGLNCIDVQIVDSENETYPSILRFVLRNEFGFDISNISIMINGICDSVMNMTGEIAKTSLLNKEQGTYGFPCPNLTGLYVKETVSMQFTNTDTGNTHRKVGYISVNPGH
ncbi:MAG: hypothetical protein KJ574_02190 [Nanoarchaeota archaeon]|nr:hypothetical protein [Nanoarchaeota archaeon]